MRKIEVEEYGQCNICKEHKKILYFKDEQVGHEGWLVTFGVCLDCCKEKLS